MIYADNFFLDVEHETLQEFGLDSVTDLPAQITRFFSSLKRNDITNAMGLTDHAEAALARSGIDLDKIRATVRRVASPLTQRLKLLREDSSSLEARASALSNDVQKSFAECFTSIYSDLSKDGEIDAGLKIFLVVFIAKIFVAMLMTSIVMSVGSVAFFYIAQIISLLAIMPFIEEYGRRYALRDGKGFSGYVLFSNSWAITDSVLKIAAGGSLAWAGVSILQVFVDQLLSALQKYGYLDDLSKGADPQSAGRMHFLLAVILKGLWNFARLKSGSLA